MPEILVAYLITFGWAVVGSLSMGVGIIITLKMFDLSTRDVNEWELIKQGNIPMSIILASVIVSLGLVVSAVIHP
jgi:uncharacterized membrane protein YjfL (UPF0719 family)